MRAKQATAATNAPVQSPTIHKISVAEKAANALVWVSALVGVSVIS